jgi:hypothetical protein
MTAAREAAQTALDRLWIGRDLDRSRRAMDQLVGEWQPAAAVIDPSIDILGPGQTRRRQHASDYTTVTRELRL